MRFFCLLILPVLLQATFVGNTASPALIEDGLLISDTSFVNFRISSIGGSVGDERLNFRQDFSKATIQSICAGGQLTINFKEKMEIFGDLIFDEKKIKFENGSYYYYLRFKNAPIYVVGTKLILFEIKDFTLGADAKVLFERGKSFYYTINEHVYENRLVFRKKEWQVALGISEKIDFFTPYISGVVRGVKMRLKHLENETRRLHQKYRWGMAFGTSISSGPVSLTIEKRMINENSFFLILDLRF